MVAGLGLILGAGLGALGGVLDERQSRKFRRRQRKAIEQARKFADATVKRITEDELFVGARDFISDTFKNAADSPLAKDFAKSVRAAQSVRGTFSGNISAAAEGIGTSAAAQRLRTQLLPSALQFAEAPERLRQSVISTEAPLFAAAATGAPIFGGGPQQSPFSSAISGGLQGAAGGFQIGSAFDQQNSFEAQLAELRKAKADRQGSSGFSSGFDAGNSSALEDLINSFGGGGGQVA
jgi:hypothetical protein